jgi:3-deoxy-D-manno-octulosonic-acid transferase
MSLIWLILYNLLVVPLIYVGFGIGSLFNVKIREGLKSRRNQFRVLSAEISKAGDRKRILFHCTSAGEWLQALPIIEKLKSEYPRLFIMVSFYSPSGFRFAKNPPEVDLKFYLPLDSVIAARRLFKMLKPELWIISKFDIWPNHVMVASAMKIPMVVTSATLSADSRRDKGISKGFNTLVYNRISHIFPISAEDKRRFQVMVPDEQKYTVAGDTRYDHVYNRGMHAAHAGDVNVFNDHTGVTFIAGSTWPPDEKHILPALADLCLKYKNLKVIVAPHELNENHLSDIEAVFANAGIETERYSSFAGSRTSGLQVVIFNTIGMLARLYKQTNIAFIGGSFARGIHNVMEPAVFGQPVIFGPNFLNSHEAGELLKRNASFTITNRNEFYSQMSLLITDARLRSEMGTKASELIAGNIGATDKIIKTLKEKYDIFS